jgi:c-di-GMP-binding flagellar brake protein YcgR
MDAYADRRSKVRIIVGDDVTIRFRNKQTDYQDIRITNLSADGCFATLPRSENSHFRQGSLLEDFSFGTADLFGPPFSAKVAYVLGGNGGGRGGLELIGLGIHFLGMTPEMAGMLADYVEKRI